MPRKLEYRKPEGKYVEYLNRYFTIKFRSGYVRCDDVLLPEYFTKLGDRIRDMDVRADDIWVCSFPKTGTTWTQEMVWCIANDVDLKAAEVRLPQRFPFLEASAMYDWDLMSKELKLNIADNSRDSFNYIEKLSSPRFIKSHLPFKLLPEKLQQKGTNAKIIYVMRNVRDTCVSYYHHCKWVEGYRGDFEPFCDLFLSGNVPFAPFWDHVFGYWEQRHNPNVLILKYEDMKKDLQSIIYKTAKFLGKTLNEDQVAKLLKHLSFQSMKENRAVNLEAFFEIFKKNGLMENEATFMRKGEVGNWKQFFTVDLNDRFEEWAPELMAEMLGWKVGANALHVWRYVVAMLQKKTVSVTLETDIFNVITFSFSISK